MQLVEDELVWKSIIADVLLVISFIAVAFILRAFIH